MSPDLKLSMCNVTKSLLNNIKIRRCSDNSLKNGLNSVLNLSL